MRSVLPVLLLAACATEPTAENLSVELQDLGVASAVVIDDHVELRDDNGVAIGRVSVEDTFVKVTLRDRNAQLAWSTTAAWGTCNGTNAVIANKTLERGWSLVDVEAMAPCAATFTIGERVAAVRGVELPWRSSYAHPLGWWEELPQPEQGACTTIDTWSWGSSCSDCWAEAFNQFCRYDRPNCGTPRSSGSCSSGTVYSTCSATYCTQ